MKAAILKEIKKPLVVEDVPIPELSHGEALVRTKFCGICGTDLHIWEGTGYKPKLPHILGHEPAGIVERVAEGVSRIKAGDRVVPNIFFACGECIYCRNNRETLCINFNGALGVGIPGGYAEYFKAPSRNLFTLPDSIGFKEGCVIADAVVTAVHAVRRRAKIRTDDVVVVIGVGGVGQSVIQVAKHEGAKVISVVRRRDRIPIAEQAGSHYVINSNEGEFVGKIRAITGGPGVDIVIDNVGSKDTLLEGLSVLAPGGKLILVGETDDTIPFSTFKMCVNEFEIIGSRSGGRQDTIEAIDLVARGVARPYVSHVYNLNQVNNAFNDVKEGRVMGRAVISID